MEDQKGEGLFVPSELKLFRYTAVLASAVVMTSLIVFIIWIFARLISIFYPLLLPLSVAGVMALVLYPVVDVMKRRLHMPHVLAVSVLLVVFMVSVAVAVMIVLPFAIEQGKMLWESLPEMAERVNRMLSRTFPTLWDFILSRVENWQPEEGADGTDPSIVERAMGYMGVLVGLLTVPFFLFFALLSGRDMREHTRQLLVVFRNDTQKEIMYLVEVFVGYVTTFFQGQLLIAVIMGLLLALGFTLIGLQAGIAAGIVLGLLNIVPYLGVIVGLMIILPLAYVQPGAGFELVALSVVVFAVVQLIESWLLTPKIMGDRSGLHPGVVVISIFFWGIALGGLVGMILAVPLSAFIVALWRHIRAKLAQQLVPSSVELSQEEASGLIQLPEGDSERRP